MSKKEDLLSLLFRSVEDGQGGYKREPFPLEEWGITSDDERVVELDNEDEYKDDSEHL